MTTSTDSWERFFKACGVPANTWKKYADSFVKQRIHPHLLRDLSKEDLRELGISTLGDQLAIIRYVKLCDGNPPEIVGHSHSKPQHKSQSQRDRRSATYSDDEDEPMAVDKQPPSSKAPDRHDIYHIKMPEGKTQRTRTILEMHNALKEKGVIKRGVSGIRRSGVELHGVESKSKTIQKSSKPTAIVVQDTDVTSSTVGFVPVGSLRSDMISTKTTVVKDISPRKQTIANRMSTSSNGAAVPIKVKLDIPQIRKLQHQQQLRKVVTYDDVFDDEEQIATFVPNKRQRLPIAERIQIIGRGSIGTERGAAIGRGRRRPIVTVAGRKINFGGGTSSRGSNTRRTGGVSILDRITMA